MSDTPPAGGDGRPAEGSASLALVGERVGAYRIDALVGSGGMGAVYRAVRADGAFERTVALKVTREGLAPRLASRFRHERRLLAALDHPSIARLLDAGHLPDGRPWLAMEYVEGEPVTAYADGRRLGVEARLGLFVRIAGAVAHAHRALVVHRDLKPSNVLVATGESASTGAPGSVGAGAGEPQVKLLDFGIAKLLDGAGDDDATVAGAVLMTPAYAAPEQLRGGPVSTATDVYALGVLLYELLAGRRPPRWDAGGVPPPEPSVALGKTSLATEIAEARRTTPDALAKSLRGDLDAIVMKALQEQPEKRYGSVEALTRDVRRHLAGRPVDAHPGTPAYRLARFVRRHRGAVAAAGVSFLLLAAVASVALRQRAEAQRERDRAVQSADLLVGLLGDVDPEQAGGSQLSAVEFLDRMAARLDGGLQDDPVTRAEAEAAVGRAYGHLGVFDRAEALQRRALATREQALGPTHPSVLRARADLADLLTRDSRLDEAADVLEGPLERGARALGESHPAVSAVRHALGVNLMEQGRFPEAEAALRRAFRDRRRVLGDDHPDVAHSYADLGQLYRRQGHLDRAETAYREAADRYRAHYGPRHPRLAVALNEIGVVLKNGGDYAGAEPYYREALALFREAYGDRHPTTAQALGNLALLLKDRALLLDDPARSDALYAEAEPMLMASLDRLREIHGADHLRTAHTEAHLGMLALARGRGAEAEGWFRRSLAHHDAARTPALHSARPYPMTGLGEALLLQDRAVEAEPLLREALRIRETATPGHWRIAEAQSALADGLTRLGRVEEADRLLRAAERRMARGDGEFARLARLSAQRRAALDAADG